MKHNWIAAVWAMIIILAILYGFKAKAAEFLPEATMRVFEVGLHKSRLIGVRSINNVATCRLIRNEYLWLAQIIRKPMYITCTPQEID